jgi:mannosylfructose-phosphate synthase
MSNLSHELFHNAFLSSPEKHVLMITNHGIHQWDAIPGLPDTGGQNVFVNQLTDTLERRGLKITIVNRGGYAHPVTGEMHKGLVYKNKSARILYIEDDVKAFVPKEQMEPQLPALADELARFVFEEGPGPDLIISHYWDGAMLGILLNKALAAAKAAVPHVWVPHSLGSIKRRNVKPFRRKELNIDRRIEIEKEIVQATDLVADTSTAVREALLCDYQTKSAIFLPPCVQTDRFSPVTIGDNHEIWSFLSGASSVSPEEIRRCAIVSEISRTDTTKRKNILIDAFARVHKEHPDTFLVVAIDRNEKKLSDELLAMIDRAGIATHTAVIGNEWDRMPFIYAVSDVYCSPSIMEGFGMSAQEAAATGVPVVGSTLIPFVMEYLLGDMSVPAAYTDDSGAAQTMVQGEGAVAVRPDDPAGFAAALRMLIENKALREKMGRAAYQITIPYFTWDTMVNTFFETLRQRGLFDDKKAAARAKEIGVAV